MKNNNFKGLFTAIVTPFKDGKIDYLGLEKLIELQIQNKVDGVIIAGSTGEKFSLDENEYRSLAKFAIEKINGRILTILGTGTNDTKSTIKYNEFAKGIGYDGVLVVSPYYNKPSQEGIYTHFQKIADTINIPIILYNVPSRTSSDIGLDIILRLASHENIVAIKESSSDLKKIIQLKNRLKADNFTLLAGDDFQFLNFAFLGAKGLVSVASNAIPSIIRELVSFGLNEDFNKARSILFQINDFIENLFIETNPTPIKECLKFMGYISNEVRLPLLTMTKDNREILLQSFKEVLKKFKVDLDYS